MLNLKKILRLILNNKKAFAFVSLFRNNLIEILKIMTKALRLHPTVLFLIGSLHLWASISFVNAKYRQLQTATSANKN
jgi:hypothetical protein